MKNYETPDTTFSFRIFQAILFFFGGVFTRACVRMYVTRLQNAQNTRLYNVWHTRFLAFGGFVFARA